MLFLKGWEVCLQIKYTLSRIDLNYLNYKNSMSIRCVLTVMQRTQHGHQLHTVCSYVSTVQQGIEVLAFIYLLFVRQISILIGAGYNYGTHPYLIFRFCQNFYFFIELCKLEAMQTQLVEDFIKYDNIYLLYGWFFRKLSFNNMDVKPKIYSKSTIVEQHSCIVKNYINLLRKQCNNMEPK